MGCEVKITDHSCSGEGFGRGKPYFPSAIPSAMDYLTNAAVSSFCTEIRSEGICTHSKLRSIIEKLHFFFVQFGLLAIRQNWKWPIFLVFHRLSGISDSHGSNKLLNTLLCNTYIPRPAKRLVKPSSDYFWRHAPCCKLVGCVARYRRDRARSSSKLLNLSKSLERCARLSSPT